MLSITNKQGMKIEQMLTNNCLLSWVLAASDKQSANLEMGDKDRKYTKERKKRTIYLLYFFSW